MVLTSQQYGEILNCLRAMTSGVGTEKRRTTRVDVNVQIKAVLLDKGSPAKQITVFVRDISIDGVGLFCGTMVSKGQRLVVILPRKGETCELVLSDVTFCDAVADGIFNVGCRFVKSIEPGLFEKLKTATNDAARPKETAAA